MSVPCVFDASRLKLVFFCPFFIKDFIFIFDLLPNNIRDKNTNKYENITLFEERKLSQIKKFLVLTPPQVFLIDAMYTCKPFIARVE